MRGMIDQHDTSAKASGARIVHFCGHDCVPWDLCGEIHAFTVGVGVSSPVMISPIVLSISYFFASITVKNLIQFSWLV